MARTLWFFLLLGCGGTTHSVPEEADGDADSDSDGDADADADSDDGNLPPDEWADALFDPDRLIEIVIEMDPEDAEELARQTRTIEDIIGGADCLAEPHVSPFTYFPATVTVDGERLEEVGVRKKGFLGSLSETKPALKLDFGEFVPDRELHGLNKLTLNNSVSDPSYVRQCLTYQLFADAGIPAPRCNFAHVVVNGIDLGVYVHLQSVGEDMLGEWFDEDEGDLWEGAISDFRSDWVGTLELKTNEQSEDRSRLGRVVEAAEASDGAIVDALGEVIDVDQFTTFWAMEVLTAHWDGYAGNTNNFFVYDDPTSGRFQFMPWGTDGAMHRPGDFGMGSSTLVTSVLPYRLYQIPEMQEAYVDEVIRLLDAVWDTDALVAEIDRMEALVAPVADPSGIGDMREAVEDVRRFVLTRHADVTAELDALPPITDSLREAPCMVPVGDASGTFEATFGTLGAEDPFAQGGTGSLAGVVSEAELNEVLTTATAGFDPNNPGDPRPIVQIISWLDTGKIAIAHFSVDPAGFVPGAVLALDFAQSLGMLYELDVETGEFSALGMLTSGTLTLDAASVEEGAAVTGSFEAEVVDFPWM